MGSLLQKMIVTPDGEIMEATYLNTKKYTEKFGMYRETEGLDWLLDMDGKEIKLVTYLMSFTTNNDTFRVVLGTTDRHMIGKKLKMTQKTFQEYIRRLERKMVIYRLSRNELLINPRYFFKGSSGEVPQKMVEFYELYNKKFGTDKIPFPSYPINS
ncbi:hypothetical protein AGMMS50239_41130 [Bacteroidia bacterium]|nr:hypothetical protein AGMMS50239_41130 [Bacteroidia bacterium]